MYSSLVDAHNFSSYHKDNLIKDEVCGCFSCMKIFNPSEIKIWIKDTDGNTAVCPYCNIDSILGESSGFPITEEFLIKMNNYWF